ncbi:hypothetical protein [Haloprofundus salinisoli]|uniref:hypothetical protein n=1 Tax=Haloprofundus salinisoli TaxID=2876193 RepID=UPI001CCE6601|nr:hypothetical protein [Haloprofundus salinisoli]
MGTRRVLGPLRISLAAVGICLVALGVADFAAATTGRYADTFGASFGRMFGVAAVAAGSTLVGGGLAIPASPDTFSGSWLRYSVPQRRLAAFGVLVTFVPPLLLATVAPGGAILDRLFVAFLPFAFFHVAQFGALTALTALAWRIVDGLLNHRRSVSSLDRS